MDITVPDAIKQLLAIVEQLHVAHPKKKFTLDGRLVGDLGETLVEAVYDVELFTKNERYHDGETSDGRRVQIKATMKMDFTFPASHVPDYYLGIQIHGDGSFSEIFNGPGDIAAQTVKGRQQPKTNLHGISVSALKKLNELVGEKDRIPRRSNK